MTSGNRFLYFLYSDSNCAPESLFSAATGPCGVCTGSKVSALCPTVYNSSAAGTPPAWPTTDQGFTQKTSCYDFTCSGSTCATEAIKTSACLAFYDYTIPAVRSMALTCSVGTNSVATGYFTDSSCDTIGVYVKEHFLTCAAQPSSLSLNPSLVIYSKYDCATTNISSVSVQAPRGVAVTNYNSYGSSTGSKKDCAGTPFSQIIFANGLCTVSPYNDFQALTCGSDKGQSAAIYQFQYRPS